MAFKFQRISGIGPSVISVPHDEVSPERERRICLTLCYDGTHFHGWQVQPGCRTVQEELENSIAEATSQRIRVAGCSRTDAGVHALGQAASFGTISRMELNVLLRALNANLPRDVAVTGIAEAVPDFHAVRDALAKRYSYVIYNGRLRDVFGARYHWHVRRRLDVDAMRIAAQALLGTHDFRALANQGVPRRHSVRTIFRADVAVERAGQGGRRIIFDIDGDGFLYNMVRTIVGTLARIGTGDFAPSDLPVILASRERADAGPTAPPQGLFLRQIHFDSSAFRDFVTYAADEKFAPCGLPTSLPG